MKVWVVGMCLLAAGARGQEVVYEFSLGGSKIGESKYSRKADGEFTSTSALKIGPTAIDSKLTGKWEKGKLVKLRLEEKAGGQSGVILWDGKAVTIDLNGKNIQKAKPVKLTSQAFFTNYHPGINGSILAERVAAKKSQIDVVVINGVQPVKCKFDLDAGTAKLKDRTVSLTKLKGEFASIGMEIVFEGDACVGMLVPSQQFTAVRKGYEGVFEDPLLKYPELSQPTHKVIKETRVRGKMRDGVELFSDIARPAEEGKYPVILIRTPYGRAASLIGMDKYAERGYVVVSQDVRGRGASGGGWDPFNAEVADGKDTLDWLVSMPWCNGNVGMIGGSYLGSVQWAAAVNHHPALKCIIPQVSPPEPTRNVPWDNGAFLLTGSVWWSRIVMERQANMEAAGMGFDNLKALRTMPLAKIDDALLKRDIPFYNEWLKRPNREDWKGAFTTDQVAQVKIPVMHVSGVWDGDGVGTMLHWDALKANGGNQWMVFGPWEHGFNVKTKFGDQDYGKDSVLELDSVYLRFFDAHLKGAAAKLGDEPRVRFFVTGSNKWLNTSDWPPRGAKAITYHLGGGDATAGKSKGLLGAQGKGKDTVRYDPRKPAFNENSLDIDSDNTVTSLKEKDLGKGVLLYRTPAFQKPTVLAGPLKAELYVSTTARDATLFVQVFDQDPNGKLWAIGQPGARRFGFVNGKLSPIQPNKVYKILVEPWLFARSFGKGHRLAVAVRTDMFPGYARNPGTGEPDATATKLVPATHTIYKAAPYASTIRLWEIPGG